MLAKSSQWLKSRRILPGWVALVALVSLGLAKFTGWPNPVEARDQQQSRLDLAAPIPRPGQTVEQSFLVQHDGLTAVELLLVVYPAENADPDQRSVLTLTLLDDSGAQIRRSSWNAEALAHNQPLRFSFAPISDSANKVFHLKLDGSPGNQASFWAYSLDGYPRGALTVNGQAQAGDLFFQTIYRYSLKAALRDLVGIAKQEIGLLMVLLLALLVPGLFLSSRLRLATSDWGVVFGLAIAGSLAILPLVWLWWTVLGGRWYGILSWGALGGMALLLVKGWKRWRWGAGPSAFHWEYLVLTAILALGFAVRLLAIRDLVLPAWVDSPQHYLISRMMAESGRVPVGYRPWMPVDVFWYHFGFHALMASLNQMTGCPVETIMLVGGQVLNGLSPLSLYAGVVLLTRRRPAGLIAAFFVALLSFFPAYFVTWGRYTQLTGLVILPPLMGLVYRVNSQFGLRSYRLLGGAGLWLSIMLSGLFLVHSRVWVYGVIWLCIVISASCMGSWRELCGTRMRGWLLVLGLAAILALPWLVRVWDQVLWPGLRYGTAGEGVPGYNDIPWGYLTYGWEIAWPIAGAAALLWALWRRKASVILVGAWTTAVFALINLDRIGLPSLWLVNNNTWIISLFVPLGMMMGWLLDDFLSWAWRWPMAQYLGGAALTVAIVFGALFGLAQMVGVVNAETVLVQEEDLVLVEWAEEYLSEDSLTVVNAWPWLGENNWAGSDAGYWLLPLTGRETSMPPIGYGMDVANKEQVNVFNQKLSVVESWGDPDTLSLLREQGVTHIVIGGRGGSIKPESLVADPHYSLLASNGSTWLFQVDYDR